jgi:hypothetical protein
VGSGGRSAAASHVLFLCDGAWFPSGNWWGGRELSLIINISQSVRGEGGPSRCLEGGALSGNSTYISYIYLVKGVHFKYSCSSAFAVQKSWGTEK